MAFFKILKDKVIYIQEKIYNNQVKIDRIIKDEHDRCKYTPFLFILRRRVLTLLKYILRSVGYLLTFIYRPILLVYILPILVINMLVSVLSLFFNIIFSIYWGIKFLVYSLDNSVGEIRPRGQWFFRSSFPLCLLMFQLFPNLKLRKAVALAKNYGIWCERGDGIDLDAYNDLVDELDSEDEEFKKHDENINIIMSFLPNPSDLDENSSLILWCRAIHGYFFYTAILYPYLTTFRVYYIFTHHQNKKFKHGLGYKLVLLTLIIIPTIIFYILIKHLTGLPARVLWLSIISIPSLSMARDGSFLRSRLNPNDKRYHLYALYKVTRTVFLEYIMPLSFLRIFKTEESAWNHRD